MICIVHVSAVQINMNICVDMQTDPAIFLIFGGQVNAKLWLIMFFKQF